MSVAMTAPPRMKAMQGGRYGAPEVLQLREIATPTLEADQILVRIKAASVNPYDWHMLRGQPYIVRAMEGLRRPKVGIPGVDLAGVVESVGSDVSEFAPGDEVFGARAATLAEYVAARERNLVRKPARLTFEQGAAIGIAGVTALQALRDKCRIQARQHVLVNGAAGGVGTFAVQIAKALGAEVTGVCSTRNVELVRSIGADHVVDYTTHDFTQSGERYDAIVDIIGNHTLRALRGVLAPSGRAALVGSNKVGNWAGFLARPLKATIYSRIVSQDFGSMMAKIAKPDLAYLGELAEAGELTPVVDRTYPLSEAAEAIAYLETKHVRGKVVVTVP